MIKQPNTDNESYTVEGYSLLITYDKKQFSLISNGNNTTTMSTLYYDIPALTINILKAKFYVSWSNVKLLNTKYKNSLIFHEEVWLKEKEAKNIANKIIKNGFYQGVR